jgi:lipopolysaccharide/colanic/teichoic acid biosynthesis glycosyltransferase
MFVKRLMDLVLSGAAIVVLFPFFLIISLLIKITMPGPIFFRQKRVGKNLKPFMLYKFRTMKINAEQEKAKLKSKNEVKGLFKMKNDPRITPFGKILRRSCIDELPQLINIFLGNMSLVGPRPHLYEELPNFDGWRMARFNVKPGLTGLWQVNGRHELNFDKAILYDIYYVKHMSLLMDIAIILKTLPAILMTKGRY